MKLINAFILISVLLFVGCGMQQGLKPEAPTGTSTQTPTASSQLDSEHANRQSPGLQQVSLNQVDQSLSMAEAMNRKILRNADLVLEVADPALSQRQITSIAETLGGFVVSSESRQRQTEDSGSRN